FFLSTSSPTTELYTLSLHDALPICSGSSFVRNSVFLVFFRTPIYQSEDEPANCFAGRIAVVSLSAVRRIDLRADAQLDQAVRRADRKSTRLNSSHDQISYAVFCLKK